VELAEGQQLLYGRLIDISHVECMRCSKYLQTANGQSGAARRNLACRGIRQSRTWHV
jgi:hypothetical protein